MRFTSSVGTTFYIVTSSTVFLTSFYLLEPRRRANMTESISNTLDNKLDAFASSLETRIDAKYLANQSNDNDHLFVDDDIVTDSPPASVNTSTQVINVDNKDISDVNTDHEVNDKIRVELERERRMSTLSFAAAFSSMCLLLLFECSRR